MNNSDDKIWDQLNYAERLMIFGAGGVAGMICVALEDIGLPVTSFVVNDGQRSAPNHIGKKVEELSEVKQNKNDCIVYGIRDKGTDISGELLARFGEQVVFEDYQVILCVILEAFYRKYFVNNGIDITGTYITIKNFRMINPFMQSFTYKLELLIPLKDLVLPPVLGDDRYIDEGPYEWGEVKLEKGNTVIDCGANVGLFSAVAASKACRVFSFEPIPSVIQQLEKTRAIYPENIFIEPYAVSDTTGKTSFYVEDEFMAVSTMMDSLKVKDAPEIEIDTITIDRFVSQHQITKVDFIKADIEGAERYMLKGAAETIKNMEPMLAISSYHLKDDPMVLENIIRELNPNYQIVHKWKTLYAFVPER